MKSVGILRQAPSIDYTHGKDENIEKMISMLLVENTKISLEISDLVGDIDD